MAFTYAGFIGNVANLNVAGVTRKHTAPPQQINSADLPLSYPRFPIIDNQTITLQHGRGLKTATVELVVVLEPYRQNTNIANFDAGIAMIDAIEDAIMVEAANSEIDHWNIALIIEEYGNDRPFWQLVARIEGSGT